MRFDFEQAIAKPFVDFLKSATDEKAVGRPIVTFYDPMSVDDASRVIVDVPSGETAAESMGNLAVDVDVGIKTKWAQPTIAADFTKHWTCVGEVRDKLFTNNLVTLLAEYNPPGMVVDFVSLKRQFLTKIVSGFIYSETRLSVKAHVTQT